MNKFENGELVAMSSEEIEEFEAWQANSEPLISFYRLYKSVFIDRMTEEEAGIMEIVLANISSKLRLKFNSVEYFLSDDPLFEELKNAVSIALSEERAEELLQSEENQGN